MGLLALWPAPAPTPAAERTPMRFQAPYTLEIETAHVKWARALAGGPIRLLAVPSVEEGRNLVELAQRLSLDLTAVSIDPVWDLIKWTLSFGVDYGARAERGDLSLVYSDLEAALTSDRRFDAILLPLNHGWNQLTPASQQALLERVRDGCGLVLIRPFESELSPLQRVALTPTNGEWEPVEPGPTESSPWRRTGDHYITRAIPVESFPFDLIENYTYSAAPGAATLIETESGSPVLAVRQFGKGRVAAFGYRNQGLAWRMPETAGGGAVDVYWEYFYALLCRALIWAAQRESATEPDWNAADSGWRIRDVRGSVIASGRGASPAEPRLPPGRYFLEQLGPADWRITTIEKPQPDRINDLAVSKSVIAEGDLVEVTFSATRAAEIELIDGFGRVIAQGTGERSVAFAAGRPLTHSGFVRAAAGSAVEQIPVRFAASSREWNDYEVILPFYGPTSYQPWIPALDEQLRNIGVTVLTSPTRNFKLAASAHLPGFGAYGAGRDAYLKRKAEYVHTGDTRYLTRGATLQSAEFESAMRAQLERTVRGVAALKPLAVYLADESSLTAHTDAFDVDWAPEALAGFREWLRKEYGSLESLNRSWGTNIASWDDALPMTAEAARRHGNFAAWADHREYMEEEFIRALRLAREMVLKMDPEARVSLSGTHIPTAHNGCNWYEIDRLIDYLQPYSSGNQDAMHHLFRPGMPLTGFTGYGLTGDDAQYEQWRRLFYGHTGASVFWQYTLLNPDLTLTEQGRALAQAFGHIQSGIGRVFMDSRVSEDGVAIHFSMASIRGAWITDGEIKPAMDAGASSGNFSELMERRDRWVGALERQGIQFRFLATPQIESGALDGFKALILPYSIAVSDKEVAEIERFMDRGGIVYADEQTGRMDERCRWRGEPLWLGGREGLVRREAGPIDVKPAIPNSGDNLVTVRDYGPARLIGILPRADAKIAVPPMPGVTYDILRGQPAGAEIEAGPDRPVLLVNRATRVAKLQITERLGLRLLDEKGIPVERSVVRVELYDPSGRFVRQYSGNVKISDGAGAVRIPWALNDAHGEWRVRARDVISGIKTEKTLKR